MIKNIKQFLFIAGLLLIAAGAQPVGAAIWQWSTTPANNATADPTINWAEGMSPSSVNDSARSMMAALAAWRNDISRAGTTGGTSSAYTLSTSEGVGSPVDGQMIALVAHTTNANGATLATDGGSAIPIYANGVTIPAGTMLASTPYRLVYNSSGARWDLEGLAGNPYNVALGSITWTTIATAPNSNFVSANGQCISNTTYSTYFAAIGSPASGSCPGGQFAVIDLRGRTVAGLDTLPGSTAANRMTSATTGCGTAFTTMGVVCANGTESWILTTAQMPSHFHGAGIYDPTHNHAYSRANVSANGATGGGNANSLALGSPLVTDNTTFAATGVRVNSSNGIDTTYSTGGGGAHPSVQPTMGLYPWLRVL